MRFVVVLLLCISPLGTLGQTPAERAKELVAKMNLDEKITMVHGTGWGADVYVGKVSAIDRLNIPAINLNDGPQGFRCNGLGKCPGGTSTCFPSGLTIGASWDPDVVEKWGSAMGKEFYGKGANVQLGPGVNVNRVPRNGRNFEYISGEDPYLGYQLAKAAVTGIQSQHVIANAKHYVLNNQETARGSISAVVDERTLFEMYLPPFQGAVDAGVGSFMCSYNRVNGEYSCEHNTTLNLDLKYRLGFDGWVMSDWRATHSVSIEKGLDQEMPGADFFGNSLKGMVQSGQISQAKLDDSIIRILTPMFALGIMDTPNTNSINTNVSTAEQMAVALELAEKTSILLKNENSLLPLNATSVGKIVIVGNQAKNPIVGGGGSGMVNPSYLPPPYNSIAAHLGRPQKNNCSEAKWEVGIDYYGDNIDTKSGSGPADCCKQCLSIPGCNYFSYKSANGNCYFKATMDSRTANPDIVSGGCYSNPVAVSFYPNAGGGATDAAASADVAIVMVGTSSKEGSDRGTLSLSNDDNEMIKQIAAAQPKTVVVTVSPGPILMPWADSVASIIFSLMPGQMFGDAIASLVFGDAVPCAKLPITIPNKDNEQGFSSSQYPGVNGVVTYSEGLFFGYRWYDQNNVKPLFPFGHGLSYTEFAYSNIKATSTEVTCQVKNVGKIHKGEEIAQLYLGFPKDAQEPPKVLRGFQKVELDVGEAKQITFPLKKNDISIWDVKGHAWQIVQGTFQVYVGSSSRDIRLNSSFVVN